MGSWGAQLAPMLSFLNCLGHAQQDAQPPGVLYPIGASPGTAHAEGVSAWIDLASRAVRRRRAETGGHPS
jgi:hypothetical protein